MARKRQARATSMGNVESVGCCGPDRSSARLAGVEEEESPFIQRRGPGEAPGERMKPAPDATQGRRGMPAPVPICSRGPASLKEVSGSAVSSGSRSSAPLIPIEETEIPPNGPSTPNGEVAVISRHGRTSGPATLEEQGYVLRGGAAPSPYTQLCLSLPSGFHQPHSALLGTNANQRRNAYSTHGQRIPLGGSAGFPDYIEDGLKPKLVPAHTALTPRRLAWGQSLLECRAQQLQTNTMEVL